ncbi:MAG: HAMP domain-containing histidine kinase [Myxococcaceae bacterium]|nr:HAMP domain-containing histidine kinase [Myxococcaceae bacterium]
MTFRRRLVIAATLLTAATLGVAFGAVYFTVNRDQERQLDAALLAEAKEEAREAAALGGDELAISDRPGPAANDVGPLTKYGALYSTDGAVLASTPTFRGQPPQLAWVDGRRGEPFDFWAGNNEHLRGVLVDVPAHRAVLLLAAPRADLDGDAAFLRRAMLLVFAAAAAWAIAIAYWIVRRLTRDHAAIATVARQVAAGDLHARIAVASSDVEVAQLARDVNEMIERLSRLLAAQGTFIAHAAHELRAPLTTLYGELSHAVRRSRDAEAYRQSIEGALESAKHLTVLADDLLALARVSAEPSGPREDVDVASALEHARKLVVAEADAREVTVKAGTGAAVVHGRRADLERLFRNLLENAVRHSPKGGVVGAEVGREGGFVVASVVDQGPGVPEEDRERIFEPFYRGARAQAHDPPGAGLGLAIARQIARAHGGEVALRQAASAGGVFVVRLPLTAKQ